MKNNPKLIRQIMSMLVIVILLIPAITMYEAEKQTVNRVLNFQGLYNEGEIINVKPLNNKTEAELQTLNEVVIGSDLNSDSFVYADNNIVKEMYYGNWITYIGNGTYSVNYVPPTFSFSALEWDLNIPIAINGSALIEYDFIRVTLTGQDFPHPLFFLYWSIFPFAFESGEHLAYAMDTNKQITHQKLLILSSSIRSAFTNYLIFNNYPELDLYLRFQSVPYISESKDFGDGNFTFKLEGIKLNETHSVFWDENKLLYLSLGFVASILTVGTVFSTVQIDIKTGNKKIKRKNK